MHLSKTMVSWTISVYGARVRTEESIAQVGEERKSILGLAPKAPLHPPPSFALAGALRRKDW